MRKQWIWIGILTGLFLCISALLAFNSLYVTELHHTETIDADHIKTVNVRTELLDVTLYESKDDQIHASLSGSASRLSSYNIQIEREQDTLNIRSLETNAIATSVSFSKSISLQLYLPPSIFDKVSIYTIFGSLYAEDQMSSKLLHFKSTLGGAYIKDAHLEKIVAESNLGNIQIGKLYGGADIHTSSGNISISYWEPSEVTNLIHTHKGNIQISAGESNLPLTLDLFTNGILSTNLNLTPIPFEDSFKTTGLNRIYGTTGRVTTRVFSSIEVSSDTGQIIYNKP